MPGTHKVDAHETKTHKGRPEKRTTRNGLGGGKSSAGTGKGQKVNFIGVSLVCCTKRGLRATCFKEVGKEWKQGKMGKKIPHASAVSTKTGCRREKKKEGGTG